MSDSWYYDFMNLNHAVSKALVNGKLPYEIHYVKDIMSTSISMFKIKNIERIPNLTSQILEMALMFNFNLCTYKHPALGWILCRYVCNSVFNEYLRPKTVNLQAFNGTSLAYDVPYEDIVLIRDNSMDIIPFICINEYICKIHRVEETVFKTLAIASLPIALVANKKMANQLKQVAKNLGNSDPFITGDDSLLDIVKGFNIDVPVSPLDIYELKQKYRNECLSSLGIYSVEEKRERIVTQELVNQNDFTDFVYQDRKMERKRWVDEMNKRDPSLQLELIEEYEVNVKENIKDDAAKARAIAKADGTYEKNVNAGEGNQEESPEEKEDNNDGRS